MAETLPLPQVPQLEVFPRAGSVGAYRPPEAQLGLLSCFLRDGWLLSWNEYSVYVLDWVNEVGEHLGPPAAALHWVLFPPVVVKLGPTRT